MILVLIFIFRIQLAFLMYINFLSNGYKEVTAKVINQYKKKDYYVLKLKNNEITFYTTTKDEIKDLLNETLTLTLITKKISFKNYLTTFYAPSFNIKLNPISKIEYLIEKQHKNKEIINLFKALYLAEAISYSTREKLSTLGISHLFALSGLHLGFISFMLFLIFSPIYQFFQRFFPYRNRFFDLGAIILCIEGLYLYFVDFPPSLIRAYVMEIILFIFAIYFAKVISLKVLLLTILFSFLIFFTKIFSIGFFLSIIGVYYIFLFFKYFKANFISSMILAFYIFLVMFVISHHFFGNFNIYQLLSPIANIAFTFFYPISIALHIFNLGGIFDNFIEKYLNLGKDFIEVKIDTFSFISFIIISLLAYLDRKIFFIMVIIALIVLLNSVII